MANLPPNKPKMSHSHNHRAHFDILVKPLVLYDSAQSLELGTMRYPPGKKARPHIYVGYNTSLQRMQ